MQGNLSVKNGTSYAFDYGNRLRTTAGLTYRYDADGRRVRQDNAGTQLKYSYYAKNGRLVWQRDEPNSKRISNLYLAGSLVAEYTRPIGSTTVTISYLHTDALGSPIAKTNSAGSVIETSEYEPYGKLLNRANDDRAGYTGHVMDSASELTYMQQRYYDPQIGRFLSVDPVKANGSIGSNFNRYWYTKNNPYGYTDPDGRQSKIKRAPILGWVDVHTTFRSDNDSEDYVPPPQPPSPPTWSQLYEQYQFISDMEAGQVIDFLGGEIAPKSYLNGGAWKNACALRCSYAINNSGYFLPRGAGSYKSGDGKYYYADVMKLAAQINKIYGSPKKILPDRGLISPAELNGKRGIILFLSENARHIDLWDGNTCVSRTCNSNAPSWFLGSYEVRFWEIAR